MAGLINSGIKLVLDPTLPGSTLLNESQTLLPIVNNNEKSLKVKDSVAFVIGSSRGIRRAIAIAREGAKVIIHRTTHDSPNYLNEGHVIIVGSTSALRGREKDVLYTVSKAAIHQYMKCLVTQVQSSGIRINCIAPGATLTERYK
ncbi:unnamed protein product [Rotaria sordida]|uniref:Uncharacterized protein n=1 Tax=Rotaria sordida TaxID=392033 RepID=A0A814DW28_9BILA|nr:unnamed protein product [Rotaria sordida]CAF1087592.1 unnamed protein product [Rotaria sordida]CAF1349963.1 unnamed protein product [Rotaria sordida]CAF4120272.1 unnamed protein product [Rotaria sordida]